RLVRRGELGRAFTDALLQVLVRAPQRLFSKFALGDVARHFRRADDGSLAIHDRGDGQRNGDMVPVPGAPQSLEMIDSLAPAKTSEHVGLFSPAVFRDDQVNVLADGLGRRVSKEPLGASIPGGDNTIQRLAHDGVVRRIDDGRQQLAYLMRGRIPEWLELVGNI